MYVNSYTSHTAAAKSYNNFFFVQRSFTAQFVISKFICLFCLIVCFFLDIITIVIGSELVQYELIFFSL